MPQERLFKILIKHFNVMIFAKYYVKNEIGPLSAFGCANFCIFLNIFILSIKLIYNFCIYVIFFFLLLESPLLEALSSVETPCVSFHVAYKLISRFDDISDFN